ncbi:MAG TPA: IS200/IS605 family transposase [Chloroflexi bacterium]|nr:IS200/IS605 family transposase [Chloroflexota bacterium]
MPDHLHLLVQPPGDGTTVSRFVQELKSMTTRLYWKLGGAGKLWQRGFYDHILREDEDLTTVGEYILHNPIRKGLIESAEKYPYSGVMDDIPS